RIRIHQIVSKKVDVINMVSDSLLAEPRLLKPRSKFVKDGLVIGLYSSHSCIVRINITRIGITHKNYLAPLQEDSLSILSAPNSQRAEHAHFFGSRAASQACLGTAAASAS